MQRFIFISGLILFIISIAGCAFHKGNTSPIGIAALVGIILMGAAMDNLNQNKDKIGD